MSDNNNHNDYEDVCFICRRPESKAGKMFHLPGNICICNDCMHATMDSVTQMDNQGMFNNPYFNPYMNTPPQPPKPETDNAKGGQDTTVAKDQEAEHIDSDHVAEDPKTEKEDSEQKEDADQKEDSQRVDFGRNINGRGFFPNISFVNLSDLQGEGVPFRQKVKKKKKSQSNEPVLNIKDIPAPHKIKEKLDDYVVGQDYAKKVISVAVYNHYKRVATGTMDEIDIEKSNILMIGPTGCGKTYLVKTLAKLLDVPLAIADATSLTEAGYIGDDIESVVTKLLAAADNDVDKAERGIIFIDEIDKIAKKKNTTSRDVSGESVQQGMLKLLEGAEVEVPVGANSKNAMVPLTTVNTKNILFICGGAFPDLEEIIKQRLRKQTSIGFDAELKDKYDKEQDILEKVTIEDLKQFGLIPEFIGRLPIICTLKGLNKESMVKILSEPKNAILKQYQKLLELDEVKLDFDEGALEAIAEKVMEKDTGARALRAIIEDFMLDIMYEIPKDDNIGHVTITRAYIEGTGGPIIEIRSNEPQTALLEQKPEQEVQTEAVESETTEAE